MDSNLAHPGELVIQKGNGAIISKWIRNSLHKGDLTLVRFERDGRFIPTVRRVTGVPGDVVSNVSGTITTVRIPDGYYYLSGDSVTALDSKQLGLFRSSQLLGKVIVVLK
jgi:signal peptidase I